MTAKNPNVTPSQATVIGPSCRIAGDIALDGDAVILGVVDGALDIVGALTIGEHGRVNGSVQSGALDLRGTVEGDVTCEGDLKLQGTITGNVVCGETVELTARSRLVGDLYAKAIAICEGATYRGHVVIGPEPSTIATLPGATAEAKPDPDTPPTRYSIALDPNAAERASETRANDPIGRVPDVEPGTKAEENTAVAGLLRRRSSVLNRPASA